MDYAQAVPSQTKTLTIAANGSATLTGTNIQVVITIFGGFVGAIPAFENISAHSVGAATFNSGSGTISQPFDGTVSFTSLPGGAGTNLLTATFTNVSMTNTNNLGGTNTSPAANLGAAQPPQLLALTSDLLPASELSPPVTMSISLGLNKALVWDTATGTITPGTYKATETGLFQQANAVPEPSSFLVAGIGGLGLVVYGLRRRKAMGV
jgi:hypothetical protein